MTKKMLFIDRDSALLNLPENQRIETLEKLAFYPKVITQLNRIARELDYNLALILNQASPEALIQKPHVKMLEILENEGIHFSMTIMDQGLTNLDDIPEDSCFISGRTAHSAIAKSLGAKFIYLGEQENEEAAFSTSVWPGIYNYLRFPERTAAVSRKTHETDIHIHLNLDGSGKGDISTGIGFFDHMLAQLARHSFCDLTIKVDGDLEVDEHHTIEDTALALGEAYLNALGDKRGIERYGFLLPMDDVLAQVAIDFSGRNWLVWDAEFKREKIGEMPTEMFFHFFKSFSDTAKCNLNIKAEGQNEHHKIEAIFKAWAKSIKMAVKRSDGNQQIPSTKGVL